MLKGKVPARIPAIENDEEDISVSRQWIGALAPAPQQSAAVMESATKSNTGHRIRKPPEGGLGGSAAFPEDREGGEARDPPASIRKPISRIGSLSPGREQTP